MFWLYVILNISQLIRNAPVRKKTTMNESPDYGMRPFQKTVMFLRPHWNIKFICTWSRQTCVSSHICGSSGEIFQSKFSINTTIKDHSVVHLIWVSDVNRRSNWRKEKNGRNDWILPFRSRMRKQICYLIIQCVTFLFSCNLHSFIIKIKIIFSLHDLGTMYI